MKTKQERFEDILFNPDLVVEQIEKLTKVKHVTEIYIDGKLKASRTIRANGTSYTFEDEFFAFVNGKETPAVSVDLDIVIVKAKRGFDVYQLTARRKTNHITRSTHRLIGNNIRIENVIFLLEERGTYLSKSQLLQLRNLQGH